MMLWYSSLSGLCYIYYHILSYIMVSFIIKHTLQVFFQLYLEERCVLPCHPINLKMNSMQIKVMNRLTSIVLRRSTNICLNSLCVNFFQNRGKIFKLTQKKRILIVFNPSICNHPTKGLVQIQTIIKRLTKTIFMKDITNLCNIYVCFLRNGTITYIV